MVKKAVKPKGKKTVTAKGNDRAKDAARLKEIQRQVTELLDEANSILHGYPMAYEKSRVWMDRVRFSIMGQVVPDVSPRVTMEDSINQIEADSKT